MAQQQLTFLWWAGVEPGTWWVRLWLAVLLPRERRQYRVFAVPLRLGRLVMHWYWDFLKRREDWLFSGFTRVLWTFGGRGGRNNG